MKQPDRLRRILDLLLTGYSAWSFAADFAKSEEMARLNASKAVEWWLEAARLAGERLPLGLQVLPARLSSCWNLPDFETESCIQEIEAEIQEWFIEIMKKVIRDGSRSGRARSSEEAQGASRDVRAAPKSATAYKNPEEGGETW